MAYTIDPAFESYFNGRLKQVFLYITDQCNLTCEQCIYKPNITFHERREIPLTRAIDLIKAFHGLGARKLTILGGEPTLYGRTAKWKPLKAIIDAAKEMGFDYVRLDTNGQFRGLIELGIFDKLDEIAFSLDGYTPEINDPVRGANTFFNAVENIRLTVASGKKATITCCLHDGLFNRSEMPGTGVHKMILFAESLGIAGVNFHDLFKAGVPMDTWTGNLDVSVAEHNAMYQDIVQHINDGTYKTAVRLPQCFITKQDFLRNPGYYGYCPVKLAERVMVHPNGVIRICSNLICSAFGVARYFSDQIVWDHSEANETARHSLNEDTPCTNRSKNKSYGKYVPLCFSFKPKQDEPVWRNMLQWDQKANDVRISSVGNAESSNGISMASITLK